MHTTSRGMVQEALAPSRPRDRPVDDRPRLGRSPVDLLVVLGLVGAFVVRFQATRHTWFYADDFPLAARSLTLDGLFRPYNGHLAATIVATYQAVLPVGGMTSFTPLRVVALVEGLILPAALYLRARRPLGPPLAAVAASVFVWTYPAAYVSQQLGFVIVLAAAAPLAWALGSDGRRADAVVAGSLVFGLCTSGVGVLLAVAAITHSLWRPATVRRWIAILLPSIAWAAWWATVGRHGDEVGQAVSIDESFRLVFRGLLASFEPFAFGNQVLTAVLALAFAAQLAWRVSQGRTDADADAVTWTVALVAWWVLLVASRGGLAAADVPRYRMVGAVCVLLSLLPAAPLAWPRWAPAGVRPWMATVATAAGIGLVTIASLPGFQRAIDDEEVMAQVVRQQVAVATTRPAVLPGRTPLPLWLGDVSVDRLARLAERWDLPTPAGPAETDRVLVAATRPLVLDARGGRAPARCRPAPAPIATLPGVDAVIRISGGEHGAAVRARRFGDRLLPIGRVAPGRTATLTLRGSLDTTPWVIDVDGGCVATTE